MFRLIDGQAARRQVKLHIEDREVPAREGDMLALALLRAGIERFRVTPVSGSARAPLCLMGACFDCLVEVDGMANVQACMVTVRDGMRVRLQHGARRTEAAR
jgi:predicted molibdopterin-dependent oxidoreductase YjgC